MVGVFPRIGNLGNALIVPIRKRRKGLTRTARDEVAYIAGLLVGFAKQFQRVDDVRCQLVHGLVNGVTSFIGWEGTASCFASSDQSISRCTLLHVCCLRIVKNLVEAA